MPIPLVLSLAAGCVEHVDPPKLRHDGARYTEDDVAAALIVRAANELSRALLESAVRLDAIQASNLVSARAGSDGLDGTADDVPFVSLAEVDGVPEIDACALDLLYSYAVTMWGEAADLRLDDAIGSLGGAANEDRAGVSVSGAGDVNADGYPDVLVGAYGVSQNGVGSGAAYLVYGSRDLAVWDKSLASADARFLGEAAYDAAGSQVRGAGDVNGDGFDDILVSAPQNDHGARGGGSAYLLYGPVYGDVPLAEADARVYGKYYTVAGTEIGPAGDLNGDGLDDVIVVSAFGPTSADPVAVAVLYGPLAGDVPIEAAPVRIFGDPTDDAAWYSAAVAGDLNADGVSDLVVGAVRDVDDGYRGEAYVLFGPVEGDIELADADVRLWDSTTGPVGDGLGTSVAAVGDVNGDGRDDIAIGAPSRDSGAGALFIVYGPIAPGELDLAQADGRFYGTAPLQSLGQDVVGAGDVNGDGYDDVFVSEPRAGTGAAHILYGPVAGVIDVEQVQTLSGVVNGQYAGASIATAGDLDRDGRPDLLVGAPYPFDEPGTAYVVLASQL